MTSSGVPTRPRQVGERRDASFRIVVGLHLGEDRARAHRVDADPARARASWRRGRPSCEAAPSTRCTPCSRGTPNRARRSRDDRCCRRPACADRACAQSVEDPHRVDLEHAAEAIGVHRLAADPPSRSADARVQHDDVERPRRSHRLVERRRDTCSASATSHDHHARPGLLHLGPGCRASATTLRPRVDEPTDHGEPDPGRSPGRPGRPAAQRRLRRSASIAEPSHRRDPAPRPRQPPDTAAGQRRASSRTRFRVSADRRHDRYRMGEEQGLARVSRARRRRLPPSTTWWARTASLFNLIGLTSPILIIVAVRLHEPEKRVAPGT